MAINDIGHSVSLLVILLLLFFLLSAWCPLFFCRIVCMRLLFLPVQIQRIYWSHSLDWSFHFGKSCYFRFTSFFFYCKDAIWSFYFYLNMSQNVFLCKTFSNFVWVFKLTGYCQNNNKPASISQLSKLWFPWRQTAHQWTFKQKGREWHEARSAGIVLVIEGLQVGSSSVGGSHSLDYAPVN